MGQWDKMKGMMARRPRGSLGARAGSFLRASPMGCRGCAFDPDEGPARRSGLVKGRRALARAAGSGAGRTCQSIGSIQRMRGIAVEREGRGMIAQDEGGECEAPPGIDPKQAQRGRHRRPGVAGASESGTGPRRGSLEWGGPPWPLRQRPRGDQPIEIGDPGPRGVRFRRDVVRAAGLRGGRGKPADACGHEDRDEPTRRAAAPDMRLHADHFRGSHRAHSSHRTWVGRRSAFGDGPEYASLYPGTTPIASVTVAFEHAGDRENARPRAAGRAAVARIHPDHEGTADDTTPVGDRENGLDRRGRRRCLLRVVPRGRAPGPAEPHDGCAGRPPGGREAPWPSGAHGRPRST